MDLIAFLKSWSTHIIEPLKLAQEDGNITDAVLTSLKRCVDAATVVDNFDATESTAQDVTELLQLTSEVASQLAQVARDASPTQAYVFTSDELVETLVGLLTARLISVHTPRFFEVAALLGLIDKGGRLGASEIDFRRIPDLVRNPTEYLLNHYVGSHEVKGPADAAVVAEVFLGRIVRLANAFGVAAQPLEEAPGINTPAILPAPGRAVWVPLQPQGSLTPTDGLIVSIQSDLEGGAAIAIVPLGAVAWSQGGEHWATDIKVEGSDIALLAHKPPISSKLNITSTAHRNPDAANPLFETSRSGTRMRINSCTIKVTLIIDGEDWDLVIEATLKDIAFVVSGSGGDGFFSSVLRQDAQGMGDLRLGWSFNMGPYLGSPGGSLDSSAPLARTSTISPTELRFAVGPENDELAFFVTLGVAVKLGLISVTADGFGMALKTKYPPVGGNLGPVDLDVSITMPRTLGVLIDADVVYGQGLLSIDSEKAQYVGAVQLQVECFSLTAIGLLNTKMPDGSPIAGIGGQPGFSLLVIIAADLPPIQLGFGFTLKGIGGLVGLNRTINLPALRAGVRTRALDSLLFPKDPLSQTEVLLQSLSAVLPVAANRFVFAPMVRLEWGAPPMLQLDFAVLIELPAPARVALLGRIRVGIPRTDESAVVSIRLDAAGTIDFGTGEVSVDAIIYDSNIAGFALTGGMALRARFREDPSFSLAVGGFHPGFASPPNFPMLERVALTLASGNNPRLRLESYLAITSNTIQFGAAVDLHAEGAGAAIDGHLSFDALLQLSPFGIGVDIGGSVALTYRGSNICGVAVHVRLTGPRPWHISGQATIKVLFISITVRFDATIGSGSPPPLPAAVNVGALLLESTTSPANWSAQPPSGQGIVSLRGQAGSGLSSLAHPLGSLTYTQNIVPLGLQITRFGAAPVLGESLFDITSVTCNGLVIPSDALMPTSAFYAPSQFLDLSEDQQLSRPSFEAHRGGLTIKFNVVDVDELAVGEAATFDYEMIVVDDYHNGLTPSRSLLDPTVAAATTVTAAAATQSANKMGRQRFQAATVSVELYERSYAAATTAGGILRRISCAMPFSAAADAAENVRRDVGEALVIPIASPGSGELL